VSATDNDEGSEAMLKIRLRRMGATNRPFYRVIVSDSRKAPNASALEEIGFYDPRQKPPRVEIDRARVDYWVAKGAQVSDTVRELVATGTAAAPAAPAAS
jgi:small subunit ribosomal protein S16